MPNVDINRLRRLNWARVASRSLAQNCSLEDSLQFESSKTRKNLIMNLLISGLFLYADIVYRSHIVSLDTQYLWLASNYRAGPFPDAFSLRINEN